MPFSYTINTRRELIVTHYVGVLYNDEYIELYRQIISDPALRHGFNELADLQEITQNNLTADALKTVSKLVTDFFEGHSQKMKTAVIAPKDAYYGLSRMYSAWAEPAAEEVSVFRDANSALEWLGLNSISLTELYDENVELEQTPTLSSIAAED